ncbi:MAG: ATP-binding protein, partial [Firmicutes bacterium]|nr:ATP-binding protein [Bacillota bacterium]
MFNAQNLQEKWAPVLNHSGLAEITDSHRKAVTAVILENQEKFMREERGVLNEVAVNFAGATNMTGAAASTGAIAGFDPVLISLIRRAMPNLVAYDICGVQPMSGPTGLIFAMKAKYENQGGEEALYNEPDAGFSGGYGAATVRNQAGTGGTMEGNNPAVLNDSPQGTYELGSKMTRAELEQLGETNFAFREMAFSIEKTSVTAKSRALKAEYTLELAQDLKAIHGLDAEQELANILSSEILAEINREIIRTVYFVAKPGAQHNVATPGVFDLDVDSNGRWMAEKFKGLLFQIDRDANAIAQETRRGKGNFIICSADVASALNLTGALDYAPALSTSMSVDDTGNVFAGTLNGRVKVFIDPFGGPSYTQATA